MQQMRLPLLGAELIGLDLNKVYNKEVKKKKKTELSVTRIFLIMGYGILLHVGVAFLFIFGAPPEPVVIEEKEPRAYLREECTEPDCDFWLLDNIAECESKWEMVQNKTSSAFGFFQIIDGTEATTPQFKEGQSKADPNSNIDMGIYLYQSRGWYPWNESRGCWGWRYQRRVATLPGDCVGVCKE